jgi:hypothetical protein
MKIKFEQILELKTADLSAGNADIKIKSEQILELKTAGLSAD